MQKKFIRTSAFLAIIAVTLIGPMCNKESDAMDEETKRSVNSIQSRHWDETNKNYTVLNKGHNGSIDTCIYCNNQVTALLKRVSAEKSLEESQRKGQNQKK